MGKPSPPPAPDYRSAAAQQGQANVEAARVQGQLNNPNVIGPYGTQTVTYGPGAGATQTIGNFDLENYLKLNPDLVYGDVPNKKEIAFHDFMAGGGTRPGAWLPGTQNPSPDQPTITQTLNPEQQGLLDQQNEIKRQLGLLGLQGTEAAQGVIGTGVDFSGAPATQGYEDTRNRVISAMMGRANEDYTRQTDQSNSDLIAAGIRPGSKAYGDRQQMIERARNDARQQAEIQGGNAAAQAYGLDEARRRQAITEMLAKRQIPLNEITALMSGSQVTSPFATPGFAQNAQVAAAPVFQANQLAGQYGTDVYNVQAQQQANLMSGLFGLGGAGLGAWGASYGGKR